MPDAPVARPVARQELRGRLATASDDQLRRVVAFLDELPDRGDSDQLLLGLRHRLVALGLRRPMSFGRLLFTPLDAVIGSAAERPWPDHRLSRVALRPLALAVQAALGPLGTTLAAACAGLHSRDAKAVALLGAQLWPRAAAALPARPVPGWAVAGLDDAAYDAAAGLCRAAWRHAAGLQAALAPATAAEPWPIRDTLAAALLEGEDSFTAVLGLMTAANPLPGRVLRVAQALEAGGSGHALALLDAVLAAGLPGLRLPPGDIGQRAAAAVAQLEDLRPAALLLRPGGDPRMDQLQNALLAQLRRDFRQDAESLLLQPLIGLDSLEQAEEVMPGLETPARALRHAAAALAKLGETAVPSAAFGSVLAMLRDLQSRPRPVVDELAALRLIEILVDSAGSPLWPPQPPAERPGRRGAARAGVAIK